MSTNLHELTKQLDALTYNSRSVLNALIRSVMAAGSSTGWTVERAGVEVTMTRTDIFLLSSFYTEWEYTRFDKDQFDTIREKLDAQYADGQGMVSDTPVTYAIVQHSKIMTMTTTDVGVADDSYWLDKVKNQVNPKMFTNSAPIPINLRTPIYDENLSTKHFDQFETYLFPRAYYTLDTLGFSGDNASHVGGGREWFFDIDDKMTIGADRTIIGVQNPEVAKVRDTNYQTLGTLNSLAGGTDSYAFGPNTFSYGLYNQVYGKNSAAVGGAYNFVYSEESGILGGHWGTVQSIYGAIAGGLGNFVTGQYGFAANENNNVGGFAFYFQRYVKAANSNTVTDCVDTFTTEDGCVYNLQLTGAAGNGADVNGTIGPNQILITTDTLAQSGFHSGQNRISSGYETAPYGYGDIKVGDFVRLSRPRVYNDNGIPNMGNYLDRTVTALEMRTYGLVVTFDNAVNRFPGVNGEVTNGYMARRHTYQLPVCNDFNKFIRLENEGPYSSAAFGFNTVAGGRHQFVAGQSNSELMRPLFIIGNGSHYIDGNTYRHNAMVVAKNYSYMRTSSQYVNFGISDYTTATQYVHGDYSYKENRKYDEDYINYQIEKYAGVYAYDLDSESLDETRAVLRVSHEHTALGIGRSSIIAHPMSTEKNPNSNKVLLEAECHEGAIGIHAGSWQYDPSEENATDENNWLEFYNNQVRSGGKDMSITMWALDHIGIHGSGGIRLHTTKYIHGEYGALTLHGISMGALTADTSDIRGLMDFKMGYADKKQVSAYIKYPGHYFMWKNHAINTYPSEESYSNYIGAYHVISNTHYIQTNDAKDGNIWSTAQLILPGNVTCGNQEHENHALPHPKLQVQNVNFPDDIHKDPYQTIGYLSQELAYLVDVKDLENRLTDSFIGAIKPLAGSGTNYMHLANVVFPNIAHAAGGVMFSVSFLQQYGKCGNAILSFAIMPSPSPHIGQYGKCVVLREEQMSTTTSLTNMKFYAVCKGECSAEIWYCSTSSTDFITSMRLIGGMADVGYIKVQNQSFSSTAPSNAVEISWNRELVD